MEANSSKITLRPYKTSDVDDFMIFAGDEKVTRFTRWHTFTTRDEAFSFINSSLIPHPFCRSICVEDRSVGYISITPESGEAQCRAEVGYALAAQYWGKGIVAKALKLAIFEAFKEFPHVLRVQALVEIENKASQRLLEKVGFVKEGVLRKYAINKGEVKDVMIFSLLSTDPMF